MLRQGKSWYALANIEYLLPPPCLEEPELQLQMASNMTVVHHTCVGFLRLVLPEDTVTVNMEVITLKDIHIFWQDKNSKKKMFIPRSEHNKPPSSFLKRLRKTQDKPT